MSGGAVSTRFYLRYIKISSQNLNEELFLLTFHMLALEAVPYFYDANPLQKAPRRCSTGGRIFMGHCD